MILMQTLPQNDDILLCDLVELFWRRRPILHIILSAGLTIVIALLFDILQRKTRFSKIPYGLQQLLIGICFGISASFATLCSGWDGTSDLVNVHVRDAAPLTAGLFFGAPAGLLAGILGGAYRYYYGLVNFTRLACSLACVMAGLVAALFRNFLFARRRPSWLYCAFIGAMTEVLHMLLILTINNKELTKAFNFVELYTGKMALSVCSCLVLVSLVLLLYRCKGLPKREGKLELSAAIQYWLLGSVLMAFFFTCFLNHNLQTQLAVREAEGSMRTAIQDVQRDIYMSATGVQGAIVDNSPWRIGQTGNVLLCDEDMVLLNSAWAGSVITDTDTISVADLAAQPLNTCFQALVYGEDAYCLLIHDSGIYYIGYIPETEVMFYRQVSMYITVFSEVLIFAGLFFMVYFITRRFVEDNLKKVNVGLDAISRGNLEEEVDVRSFREFDELSDDINFTVATLKKYIAEAEERNEKELQFAHAIQYSALPTELPAQDGFSIFGRMDTAKEVGGDFYDYYRLGEHHIGFMIADVSGKGIPAAMFMMAAKTIIKLLAEMGIPVAEIFQKANDKLCSNNSEEMFVTAWMGILDLRNGQIEFVNAGHNPPVLKHRDGSTELFKSRPGLVLAGMPGFPYKSSTLQLQPGDIFMLYTDGITEDTNPQQELFGEERLLDIVRNAEENISMEALCGRVKKAADDFAGEAPQFDDMTMLSIRWEGATDMEKCIAEITLEATVDNIERVTDFVNAELKKLSCPAKAMLQLDIAVDELFGNIVRYAYRPEVGPATVRISVCEDPMAVNVVFIDQGRPYDPLKNEDPDVTKGLDEREIGGLGIFIVKNSMDQISYSYKNGQNILRIKKHLDDAKESDA